MPYLAVICGMDDISFDDGDEVFEEINSDIWLTQSPKPNTSGTGHDWRVMYTTHAIQRLMCTKCKQVVIIDEPDQLSHADEVLGINCEERQVGVIVDM